MGNHECNCLAGGAAHVLVHNDIHTALKKILLGSRRQIVTNRYNLIGDTGFFKARIRPSFPAPTLYMPIRLFCASITRRVCS